MASACTWCDEKVAKTTAATEATAQEKHRAPKQTSKTVMLICCSFNFHHLGYDKTCCVTIFAAAQESDTSSRYPAHCANCQGSHRAPLESRTFFTCSIVQNVMFVHVSSGQNDRNRQRHSKETMQIFGPTMHVCKTSTHLPDTCLVIKLTECLLEDAKNQGSMGQYEGLRERLKKQVQATFSVKTYPHAKGFLIFWASHLGTLTAHSSHHCPQLRENATRHQEGPSALSLCPSQAWCSAPLVQGASLPTLSVQRVYFSDEGVYRCEYLQHPQNFRYWVARTRKRMDCADLLPTDRSQFNPGIMVAMVVGWHGIASVHFAEPGVKVNSAHYCEHMLTQCYWPGILAKLPATNERYHFYTDNTRRPFLASSIG